MRRKILATLAVLCLITVAGSRWLKATQGMRPETTTTTMRWSGPIGTKPPPGWADTGFRPPPRNPLTDRWTDLTLDHEREHDYISPRPGFLTVTGRADLNTPPEKPAPWHLPEFIYVWTLRVSRDLGTAEQPYRTEQVWYQEYRDQPIQTVYGTRITPEFKQELQLPPGRYHVQLGMPEMLLNPDGSLRSSQHDGELVGPMRSFWATVR
jgi:hypothetical protein